MASCVHLLRSHHLFGMAFTSSLELPYTIKRSGDSVPSKDGNRAKKPISPPPTLAAASGTAATVHRRKSASKGKSSGWLGLSMSSLAAVECRRLSSRFFSIALFAHRFVLSSLLSFHIHSSFNCC